MSLGAVSAGAYAWQVEPRRCEITRRTVVLPRLDAGLDGLRVIVMSDLHYQPAWQEQPLLRAIEAANAENADLIALPGDFINSDPAVLGPLGPLLGNLRARHGIFASMGNHDGWHSTRNQVRQALEPHGVTILVNQSTRLNLRGQRLDIAATDSIWGGFPDPGKTFSGTRPASTLALVHEPDPFASLSEQSFLQVSGHTHGGQCRVPLAGYAPVKVRYGEKFIYGEYGSSDGGRLFVSRGMGTIGLRVRFACVPEIAVLTLRSC
jgi:uncharacterized protein